jgi:hypothetical protein
LLLDIFGGRKLTRRRRTKTHPAASQPRPRARFRDPDPVDSQEKAESGACPRCGAVLRAGRWTWASLPPAAADRVCPACLQIEADQPEGILLAAGGFVAPHREEILALVRHVEDNEKQEHPLARTFRIADEPEGIVVRTTRRRLAESIGRALERAYGGRLERTAGDRATPLRILWQRD